MIVRIDKSVFLEAQDADKQLELSFLLHIILYKHRYELKVTDSEILCCECFSKLTQAEKTTVEQEIALSIIASNTDADCEVKVGGEREWKKRIFSPEEAVLFLMQPISVILENSLNDACFMNAIFQLFDSSGELTRYVNEGWLRFENAGGCANVKNFLRSRIGYYGEKEKFLRCFVLLDGDRRFPADTEAGKKYSRLKAQLSDWNVGYHVLEKRSMENYIPDEAMNALSNVDTKEWIMAYQSLSAEQKDFFCMAEGFRKDITREEKRKVSDKESHLQGTGLSRRRKSYVREFLSQAEQNFYQDVSEGNFLHLESGLKLGDFKVELPKSFTNTSFVYKSNLLARTSHQGDPYELEHIVQKVHSLL